MKKLLSLVICLSLTLGLPAVPVMAAASDIKVTLNGKELAFDVPPQIINGRTMVPMRKIGESLGAKVDWSEELQGVFISTDTRLLIMHIGSSEMGIELSDKDEVKTVKLDSPPVIINGRTLVPVRAIAEGLDCSVDWNAAARTVVITSAGNNNTQERMTAMLPVFDSILRAMSENDANRYAPKDGYFFWYTLYLMGNNWGHTHSLVKMESGLPVVGRKVIQEFASAAFLDYSDLLPVPDSLKTTIAYDAALDAYRLSPSDKGDSETRIVSVSAAANNAINVKAGLYDSMGEMLCIAEFIVVDNPYVSGIADPNYFYTVKTAALIS